MDPACGSGNFLFLALLALKDIEMRAKLEAEAMGLRPGIFVEVGPQNVQGIELNVYAAELARVSVWIGEIQWGQRNGFGVPEEPILKPLETVECRDAILTEDGEEADWPQADVVIGNPPFVGGKKLREELGGEYVDALQRVYGSRIHGEADLVCHWFDKAERLMVEGRIARGGLVATNSIRDGRNRSVLDRIVDSGMIFDAWSDEPWVIDGAAVRVSLVCFAPREARLPIALDGRAASRINADLTADRVDLGSTVRRLRRNGGVSFMGNTKNGPFDVAGELAREWLARSGNPNGKGNSDVLKPWVNGMDLVRRPAGKWIIDFGTSMSEAEAELYGAPFAHVVENVKPIRLTKKVPKLRERWWQHEAWRPGMWKALNDLQRFIATPTHCQSTGCLSWFEQAQVCPDCIN